MIYQDLSYAGSWEAGAYPSCRSARGRVHTSQVTSPKWSYLYNMISVFDRVALSFISISSSLFQSYLGVNINYADLISQKTCVQPMSLSASWCSPTPVYKFTVKLKRPFLSLYWVSVCFVMGTCPSYQCSRNSLSGRYMELTAVAGSSSIRDDWVCRGNGMADEFRPP